MSYKLVQFGSVTLPSVMFQEDMSTAPVASTIAQSAGGSFDWRGANRQWPTAQQLTFRTMVRGETLYLIDEAGRQLIDELGNPLIAGTAQTILRNQVDALAGMIGQRDQLWRERLDDGVRQWRYARLLQARPRQDVEQWAADVVEMEAAFEMANGGWRSQSATTTNGTLVSGGLVGLTINVGGNIEVRDAILTITASGTITSLAITAAALGVSLAWTGSLSSGQVLTIDCGAQTVLRGSVNQYSGFSLAAGHTARGWLPLRNGLNTLLVQSSGPGSVSVSRYDLYA